ncbi:MAG: flagellar brake domain-containing protein [Thermacetogeniaceae bacterium]
MIEKLKVNQRIQLNLVEEHYKGNYYSRVEDIVDDEVIVVAAPVKDGVLVPVNVGDKINMFFWDNTCQYAFEAKVIARANASIPIITIRKCSELQRMQRRSYFRIQAMLKVIFNIEKEDDDTESQSYEGLTLNISGGGILLSTSTKLDVGANVKMKLYLAGHDYITAIGCVQRVDFLSTRKLYRAGIDFFMIYENDRDKIVAFVFEKEIGLRRRGLL